MFNIFKSEIKYQLRNMVFFLFVLIICLDTYTQFLGDISKDFNNIEISINEEKAESLPTEDDRIFKVLEKVLIRMDIDVSNRYTYKYPTGFAKKYNMDDQQVQKLEAVRAITSKAKNYEEITQGLKAADEILEGGSQFNENMIEDFKGFFLTKEEYLEEMDNYLNKDKISGGYGRIFSDYMTIPFGLFTTFIAAYVILRDKKNNIFESIYSKRVSSWSYILGKYTAICLLMIGTLGIIALVYDTAFLVHPHFKDVEVMKFACLKYSMIWVVPTILFTNALGIMTALLFQNGIVSIVIQLLLWFKSIPLRSDFGFDKYMIRFNSTRNYHIFMDKFQMFLMNRAFYTVLSIGMIIICVFLFERKRGKMYGGFKLARMFNKA